MKVSFIIPVYNCEKYVAECIESVLANRCDFYEQEILIIDDGSNDSSGTICDRYADSYPEIKVIHQVNQGVSVARNAGLDVATGEWVMFIDADDILRSDAMRKLYEEAEFYKYDTTRFGAYLFGEGKRERKWEVCKRFSYNLKKYREMTISRVTMVTIWGGIYRRSLLDEYNIRFLKGMRFGEDGLVLNMLMCRTETFKYLDETLYGYRESDTSVCRVKKDYIPTDSHKTIATTLDYARECGVEVTPRMIEVMKSLYCRSAMKFAISHRTKAAFKEAQNVMDTYCRLPIWRIVRNCRNIKQFIGPVAYAILRPFYT